MADRRRGTTSKEEQISARSPSIGARGACCVGCFTTKQLSGRHRWPRHRDEVTTSETSSEHDSKLPQQSRSGMVTSSILSHSLSGPGQTTNCSSANDPNSAKKWHSCGATSREQRIQTFQLIGFKILRNKTIQLHTTPFDDSRRYLNQWLVELLNLKPDLLDDFYVMLQRMT
jgi:hypothetical protein